MSNKASSTNRRVSAPFSKNLTKDKKGEWVRPKTKGQEQLAKNILLNKITFVLGPAGTGKSFLSMCIAVDMLRRGEIDKIVLTRPAVEAGAGMGFLPGDKDEKFLPYLRPFLDALDILLTDKEKKKYEKCLEFSPLGYLRGSTQKSFLILDEGQNCELHELQMIITRLGSGGKFVINGDDEQSDIKRSGLRKTLEILKGIPGVGYQEMGIDDIVRDELVKEAIIAFRNNKKGSQ